MALSGHALGRCSMTRVFSATTRAASFTARLGYVAQLLSQLQQANLGADHLFRSVWVMGLSHRAGRGAALRLWLRAPASLPADYTNRPIKPKLLQPMAVPLSGSTPPT